MTVSSTTRKAGPFAGNGVVTTFPFGFKVFDKTDIKVIVVNPAGASTTLTLDSDYSVALNADQNNTPGGTVTYPIAGSPMPSGYQLVELGDLPLDQETDITNQGGFYPQVIEDMVDRATIQIQQVAEVASRAIVVTEVESSPPTLPPATARANTMLGFDASGNVTTLPIPASVGAGDMHDEVGSDGKPGLIVGTDCAVGQTVITLSRSPGTKANLSMFFDTANQGGDQIQSIVGNILTLTSGIPQGVQRVYLRTGTTLSVTLPPDGSVGPKQLADAYGSTAQRPTPVKIGQQYFDTTVGYDVVVTSVSPPVWKNVAGGAADSTTFKLNDIAVAGAAAFAQSPTGPTLALTDSSNKFTTTDWVRKTSIVNVLAYGADPTGTNDCSAAVAAAIAACPSGRVSVYFPPGKFRFTSPIAYTFPNVYSSISLTGAGSDVTELTFSIPNSPGIAITYIGALNSCHIRDMSITSQLAGGGAQGIFLLQTASNTSGYSVPALSDITNVVIRGSDGYQQTNTFDICVAVLGVSNINFTNCMFVSDAGVTGKGVELTTTGPTIIGVVYNFMGCSFLGNDSGIIYGQYIQGVTVTASNFICRNGILATPGEPLLDQLYVGASQFNCIQNAILMQSPCNGVTLAGNFVLVTPNSVGFSFQNYAQFAIIGNTFNPSIDSITNATGMSFDSFVAAGGVITGNQFYKLTTGIKLLAGSQFVNVQSNSYSGNGTNVTNSGTNNTLGGGSQ